ncbi:LysR family transcriptional regulator [bacterium]|nr:MAG: LysR family transcriptional regulator [bacterium]
MLDVRQLRYFVTVAETLHFGRAAVKLHMSQPPLSRHIAMLEKELGVSLFERTSRRVMLTAAGAQLLRDAHQLLATLDEMPGRARAADRGVIGAVKVGFTMYAANSVLPGLVRRFREEYPAVEIVLREILPQELVAELLENKLDIGITLQGETGPRLETRVVWQEPLCVALPAAHRHAEATSIHLEELRQDAFILVSRDTTSVLHDIVVASCRAAGFEPNIILETHLQQTIISLVAEGLAVALVPDSMRKVRMEGLVYRPLIEAPKIAQVVAFAPENRNPSALAMMEFAASMNLE